MDPDFLLKMVIFQPVMLVLPEGQYTFNWPGGDEEGWLGGAAAVENGILPCWQEATLMGGGSVCQRMGGLCVEQPCITWICLLKVIFLGLYHGKSPSNHLKQIQVSCAIPKHLRPASIRGEGILQD